MIDRYLHPLAGRLADRVAAPLASTGLRADHVTLAGFAVGLAAVPLLAFGNYDWALVAILANRALDGLDGALARLNGLTDRGAFLDIAFDFFFYGAIPFGFALADPSLNALPSAALLLSFIGTGSSFLALSVLAERRKLSATDFPRKGIYYIGGLTEGFETILFFAAMCIFPAWYAPLAWMFSSLCAATMIMRWIWGYRLLR